MNLRKWIALCLACLLLPCSTVFAEEPAQPAACATVLMEAETGRILSAESADVVCPMGTMAKLMTLLLTAEAIADGTLAEDTVVTASANANAQKGASIWLMPGEKMTVSDLLKGAAIGNANDAAVALAETLARTEADFVLDMNARAFELGMRQTIFTNCTGQTDAAQVTTAADLGRLCCALVAQPLLYPYMSTWRDFLRGEDTELVNENTLTRTYDGLLGIKAGHAPETGYTLAVAARREGNTYIAVVLGCADETERFTIGKSLLATGFSGYQLATPSFSAEFLRPIQVKHGVDTAVEVEVEGLVGLVVPKRNAELRTVLVLPAYLEAPVTCGQKIGTVAFYSGDTLLYEAALLAATEVKPLTMQAAFLRLLENLLK